MRQREKEGPRPGCRRWRFIQIKFGFGDKHYYSRVPAILPLFTLSMLLTFLILSIDQSSFVQEEWPEILFCCLFNDYVSFARLLAGILNCSILRFKAKHRAIGELPLINQSDSAVGAHHDF